MQLVTFTLLSLGAIAAASDAALEPQMARLIPRETWQAWQKRDNILQGGGWALVANSCPLQSTQCTDATCCPNSLLCNPTSSTYDVRAVCCPDGSLLLHRLKVLNVGKADARIQPKTAQLLWLRLHSVQTPLGIFGRQALAQIAISAAFLDKLVFSRSNASQGSKRLLRPSLPLLSD
jgi:hypothetical protein